MAERVTTRSRIVRVDGEAARPTRDTLAVEEPMEVRVDGDAVAVTMRTPGDDFALALGFCCTEGIVDDPDEVATIRYCAGLDPATDANAYNVVELGRRRPAPVAAELRRNVFTTSSCGICGTASIEAVRKRLPRLSDDRARVDLAALRALPDRLLAAQEVFERTGGLHAAALFDAEGELLALREDVGRHNAVDKLVGRLAMDGRLPASGRVLMVSGRLAFEIVQKAAWARVPIVAAVSAPTSLAVELAEELGVTLVGFLRGQRCNVYAGGWRITDGAGAALAAAPPASSG